MSSPPPESPPLSPSERQVLALLARGHTTKSIAAALNLSVYAVNERLREARRKTGAASSRELARQLAAQENWDKEIEVPEDDLPESEAEEPGAAMVARRRSRNLVIMLATAAVATIALMVVQIASAPTTAPVPTQVASAPAAPGSGVSRGTSRLDPYRARFAAETRESDWAAPSELRAWALFALVDGVQAHTTEVHCAATLCRVEGAVPLGAMERAKAGVQGDTLRDRLRGAGLDFVVADFSVSPNAEEAGRFTAFLRRAD